MPNALSTSPLRPSTRQSSIESLSLPSTMWRQGTGDRPSPRLTTTTYTGDSLYEPSSHPPIPSVHHMLSLKALQSKPSPPKTARKIKEKDVRERENILPYASYMPCIQLQMHAGCGVLFVLCRVAYFLQCKPLGFFAFSLLHVSFLSFPFSLPYTAGCLSLRLFASSPLLIASAPLGNHLSDPVPEAADYCPAMTTTRHTLTLTLTRSHSRHDDTKRDLRYLGQGNMLFSFPGQLQGVPRHRLISNSAVPFSYCFPLSNIIAVMT